jgi:hypothetical protein
VDRSASPWTDSDVLERAIATDAATHAPRGQRARKANAKPLISTPASAIGAVACNA